MLLTLLRAKLHQATVTEANLHYTGSLTLDPDLMDAVGMVAHEKIDVYNISNGERFSTYIILGERGSGIVCLNGAAARKVQKGDQIIVAAYGQLTPSEAKTHRPKIAIIGENNTITHIKVEDPASIPDFLMNSPH